MPGITVASTARSWLQAPMLAPSACTIRIAIASGGGNHDWAVSAGTVWASLDELVDDWNTALAGAATVALVPDTTLHRANVRVTTGSGATWSITWSHSGDGTAIRDRLGATGDVAGHTSGTTAWSGTVVGAWYTWIGCGSVVRGRTGIFGGAAARMMDGTVVSQHSRDSGQDPAEMDLTLRWGLPPLALGRYRFAGHLALEDFITSLYDACSDTFALYHEAGADAPERWLVRLAEERPHLRPTCLVQPHGVFELGLKLDVIEAPL